MRYSFEMNCYPVSYTALVLAWELCFFNGFIPLNIFFLEVSINPQSLEGTTGNHRIGLFAA